MEKTRRIKYLDFLRVISIFAVIVLHVSSENIAIYNVNSIEWQTMNIYESLSRWGVPVFIMISGSLFLNKENIKISDLFSKYILRLIVAYFAWSFLYSFIIPLAKFVLMNEEMPSVIQIICSAISHDGVVALWFIPMIIGLYICIPFYQIIIKNEYLFRYFLILSFVFSLLLYTLNNIIDDFLNPIIMLKDSINVPIKDMQLYFVLGYSFYFLWGYYLRKHVFSKRTRLYIYVLGVISAIMTILLTRDTCRTNGCFLETYYSNFSINVMLMSTAVFVFAKEMAEKSKWCLRISKLSKYCFGIYLVHILVRNILMIVGIDTMLFNPALSIIVITAIVSIISFLITYVLSKIPIIKKWCV